MKKSSVFFSIRWKFILFFVLLILLAMQIIGVYFVRELENRLVMNFKNSIYNRVEFLAYNVEQEFLQDREVDGIPSLETALRAILMENTAPDIAEIQIIDKNMRIIASSNINNQEIVGQRTTDVLATRALVTEESIDQIVINKHNGRIWQLFVPIKVRNNVEGIIYIEGKIEQVYDQL